MKKQQNNKKDSFKRTSNTKQKTNKGFFLGALADDVSVVVNTKEQEQIQRDKILAGTAWKFRRRPAAFPGPRTFFKSEKTTKALNQAMAYPINIS